MKPTCPPLHRNLLYLLALCFAFPVIAQDDWGSVSLNLRPRFETAEIEGLEDGENLSLRARLGYTTPTIPSLDGFKAMVEWEATGVADEDDFNAAGVSGDSAKAVIADPESSQLDQLWAGYSKNGFSAKVGRQVIALDGQRWVGHVGWRQNRQTYDALTLGTTAIDNLNLSYSYVDKAIRIFGSEAPDSGGNAEDFDSESHLLNASYGLGDYGKLGAYGYFIELDDAPGRISGADTAGISYSGKYNTFPDFPLGVYLEYANQTDAGDNPFSYSANYLHGSLTGTYQGFTLQAGYELLGSDQSGVDEDGNPIYASVVSPLATLHKFNGFADKFLLTPAKGLEDIYLHAGYKFNLGAGIGPLITKFWYHDFSTDEDGDDLGDEIDVVVVKPIPLTGMPGDLNFLFKYADYSGPTSATDTTRLSAEFNYGVSF